MTALLKRSNQFLPRVFSASRTQFVRQRFYRSEDSDFEVAEMSSGAEIHREMICRGEIDKSEWREVDSRTIGITSWSISKEAYNVVKALQRRGFDAYLVGGCVRDLTLKQVPKDFDVVTTANLKQVRKQFHRSIIVGKRFPICMVRLGDSVIEVSNFGTRARHSGEYLDSEISKVDSRSIQHWCDSLRRDFTINSLFYDPIKNKVSDYVNGIMDLKSLKLQTVIPAILSFEEDPVRILRGLRLAARLSLSISEDIDNAIRTLSSSVLSLSASRLELELNNMLSFGAAESSFFLLQRYNLLELFFPFHAAILDRYASKGPSCSSLMLKKLLSNLDEVVTSERPSHCSLWVSLLAFHQELITNPQGALVIWTFASVLYYGNWSKGVKFAKDCTDKLGKFSPEIQRQEPVVMTDEELATLVTCFASQVQTSIKILTDKDSLHQSLVRLSLPTKHIRVFISKKAGREAAKIFSGLSQDIKSYDVAREYFEIDHDKLKIGDTIETRFALGKVLMDTMNDGINTEESKLG